MTNSKCYSIDLNKELKRKLEAEYMGKLSALAEKYKISLASAKAKNIINAENGNRENAEFERVESATMEELRDMLELQDIEDFYDSVAEYRAAAELAGIEAYEYEYNEENIDELLDDVIDTMAIINERNLDMSAYALINAILDESIQTLGSGQLSKEVSGLRKNITEMQYSYAKQGLLKVINAAGKLTVELNTEEKKEAEGFNEFFDKLKSLLTEKGIIFKSEIYNV